MASADRVPQVPVVIVGAGPAGLVAAATLARNGIASLLVERNPGLSPLPRATVVSTRTMELLRSWGLEDEVRAGQPRIAAVGGWATETLASPHGTLTPLGIADLQQSAAVSPTTPAAVPQDHLEPVLLRHLRGFGLAEVRFGTELAALDQDADGVTVTLLERASGERWAVRALGLAPDGAVLVRPDAHPVTHWPSAPPEPHTELAAAPVGRFGRRPTAADEGRRPSSPPGGGSRPASPVGALADARAR